MVCWAEHFLEKTSIVLNVPQYLPQDHVINLAIILSGLHGRKAAEPYLIFVETKPEWYITNPYQEKSQLWDLKARWRCLAQ